tara:strand:+ start:236 stop:514 length:279 start_codon:yes stop_codon:yes gene_type:complete
MQFVQKYFLILTVCLLACLRLLFVQGLRGQQVHKFTLSKMNLFEVLPELLDLQDLLVLLDRPALPALLLPSRVAPAHWAELAELVELAVLVT